MKTSSAEENWLNTGEFDSSKVENSTKELEGRLDCIINNAGITQDNLAIRMSLEEWQKVIDINLLFFLSWCSFQ